MKTLKHFAFFESLLEKQDNELVQEAIAAGRIPVGYTCSYVPIPALMVDKLFPIRLRANDVEDIEHASYFLSALLCTYSRSILQSTIDGDYDFVKALVGTTACSHMCTAVENAEWNKELGEETLYSVIDIPKQKGYDQAIEASLYQYTEKLYKPMDEKYGLDYSDEAFQKAIDQYNKYTTIMRQINKTTTNQQNNNKNQQYNNNKKIVLLTKCCWIPKGHCPFIPDLHLIRTKLSLHDPPEHISRRAAPFIPFQWATNSLFDMTKTYLGLVLPPLWRGGAAFRREYPAVPAVSSALRKTIWISDLLNGCIYFDNIFVPFFFSLPSLSISLLFLPINIS